MRIATGVAYIALIIALFTCSFIARRSPKPIAKDVTRLLLALVPPLLGNLLIVLSGNEQVATVGCYMYYLGMDAIMFSVLSFTYDYCAMGSASKTLKHAVLFLLAVDVVQLLLNPVFGHAFSTVAVTVDGFPYYRLVPKLGQVFHRVVDYGIYFGVLGIFAYRTKRSPRLDVERYLVILLVMLFTGVWQSYYIFSGTPIDRSMVGFGIFGLLIFYFSLYYKPVRLLDRMLAGVVSELGEALFCFDVNGSCIYANSAGLSLTNSSSTTLERVPGSLRVLFGELSLSPETPWSGNRKTGTSTDPRYYQLELRQVDDDNQGIAGSVLSVRDRTTDELQLRREVYNSRHDHLTGIYNRDRLYEAVWQLTHEVPRERCVVGVIDVRDFKLINDVFSSDFGDLVLRRIAAAMGDFLSDSCKAVYGRLTADKFGFALPSRELDVKALEKRMDKNVVHDGMREKQILIHAGLYEVRDPDVEPPVMFDRAFMALNTIKDDYQTLVAWYDDKLRERVLWNQRISSELPDAIKAGDVKPLLQAMVDADGRVVGAEVLARWQHATEGLLAPSRFIPTFEENGMIWQVDRHMWECACQILADWQKRGIDLFLSVNISPKDFYFLDVFAEITSLVRAYGVNPEQLHLEITETVMMDDLEVRLGILDALRASGFLLEMDDFGSGWSSLNMLKDMPMDLIKVDMAFLFQTKNPEKARVILSNVIRLSDDLGIISLTEGVETMEQYEMLKEMGCKIFQGYCFSRPMMQPEFERFAKV